jgi:hypothetical protein
MKSEHKFSVIAVDNDKPEKNHFYCNVHEFTSLVSIGEDLFQCQICGYKKQVPSS